MGEQANALRALIRQRHMSYEAFCREWDRVAKSTDAALKGHYPGRAQYYRWLRGELTNKRPYSDACRMLEAMFPGWSVEALFSPYTEEIPGLADHQNSAEIAAPGVKNSPPSHEGWRVPPSGLTEIPPHATDLSGHPSDHESHALARIDQGTREDAIDVLGRVQKLHRSTVHPDVMSHLQESIRHTLVHYESLDHSSLVPVLLKQRVWIEILIDECANPVQRQQLFEIAGATSGVLGYVAVGRGDFRLARAYCLEAFQLGDFAGNVNLQAWARGIQSFCEYYAGRYNDALELAKDGINYARSGPQSVRLTINGAARAMGRLGDAEGVHRAVDEAHKLMSRNDVPDGVPSSISLECYSAAQTASNAATAYVSLAMPEKVQHYVSQAMPEISKSESPWSRSLVMIDLALSLVRARDSDLDRATMLVHDALAISAGRPIISVLKRALEFADTVTDRWGDVPQAKMILDATSSFKENRARGE
jgi:hypothetical protein